MMPLGVCDDHLCHWAGQWRVIGRPAACQRDVEVLSEALKRKQRLEKRFGYTRPHSAPPLNHQYPRAPVFRMYTISHIQPHSQVREQRRELGGGGRSAVVDG
jgi:hypothetical protein